MGDGHHRVAATRRLKDELFPAIDKVLSLSPDRLLERGQFVVTVGARLGVTRQAIYPRINKAVREGRLIEIVARADGSVDLPGAEDLPVVYAVPTKDTGVYQVQYGSTDDVRGKLSFITSPDALRTALPMIRTQLGLPEPEDVEFYKPMTESMVRPSTYGDLKRVLIATSPHRLTSSEAGDMLDAVLQVLKLKAPKLGG